jgi:hypothetical protein
MLKVEAQRLKVGFMQVLRVFVDFVQSGITPMSGGFPQPLSR